MRKTKTTRPPAACQIPLFVVVAETRARRRARLWREQEQMAGRLPLCGRHDKQGPCLSSWYVSAQAYKAAWLMERGQHLPLCQWGQP